MKSFKKLLAVVLSLAMVLGSLTVTAVAAGNVAEVTIDGNTTGYATIGEAISAAVGTSGSPVTNSTIKLLADINLTGRMSLRYSTSETTTRTITFDANGKTITTTAANGFEVVNKNTTLNITGDGNWVVNNASSTAYYLYGNKESAINVLSGTFTGGKALCSSTNNCAITIKGGVWNVDPSAMVPAGYTVTKTEGNDVWTVTAPTPACEIVGGEKYATFDEAVAALATAGTGTLKLLANCKKTEKITTIAADTEVTLDLNGYALTNEYENSTKSSTNHRYFKVSGTLTITDTSASKAGSIKVNDAYTGKAGITYSDGGTVYVNAGNFFNGAAQAGSTNDCWMNTNGGTHAISGGWFSEGGRPTNSEAYVVSGSSTIKVLDTEKAATPYTITSTKKTIMYSKNAKDATGNVDTAIEYYLEGYTTETVYAKTNQYELKNYSFMGWSTNSEADPDVDTLVKPGDVIDLTKYSDETIQFFAIWKEVDTSMWVCIKTGDPETGFASIAAGLAAEDDITLIKNYTARDTINGSGRLNLNGYNIIPDAQGSALVIKGVVSIYNEDAGPTHIGETEYNFGGEGIVRGTAQGTGGAIDAGEGATVKIYGGTFEGDAPNNGTVLTCTKTGMFFIYGGTFAPTNPESEVSTFYANNSKIYVLADVQDNVKMTGTFAKNTSGEIGIQGGWFSELQPAAIVGTYDDYQGQFKADATKSLIANTDDESYPYSVGATPWYVTYNYGTGTAPETANPTMIAKTDATEITLNAPTPAAGYTFAGFKDQDGNDVTKLQGTAMGKNLTLTAQYTAIEYTITYYNMNYNGAVAPTQTTFTVEDNVTLGTATRPTYYFTKWTEGSEAGGAEVTGWNAGEKTENVSVRANWSNKNVSASVKIGDVTVAYKDFADAVAAVKDCASEATLKLLNDITVEARVDLGSQAGLTLDLNGKTLTETTATTGSGILIYSGALTITGNGKMVDATEKTDGNKSIVCQRKDATLTIESGTFEGFKKVTTNAVPKTPGAGSTITGGTFSFNPTEYCGGLLVNYTAAVAEPATPESWTVTSTVAAAYIETSAGEFTSYKYMTGDKEDKSNYALDNIVNGDTVTLYKDAKATFFFGTEEKSFILDKNGFEYDIDNKFSAGEAIEVTATLVEGETDVYAVEIAEVDPLYVGGSIGASLSFDVYAIFRGVSENDEVSMKYVDPAADSSLPIDQRTVTVVATPEMKTKVIGQYKFTISGIYINHMADMYSFTFYVNDVLVDNMTKSTSVLKYYNELVAGEIVTEDSMLALLANTAVFAQQLQLYSNAGAPITLEDWVTTNATTNQPNKDDKNVGRSGSHASVITGVRTIVSDKVMIEFIIDSLYLGQRVSLYKDGEKQLIDGNYYEFFAQNDGAGVSIKTDKIDPLDYDATYKIVITLSDGTVLAEAHTTVNNYCRSINLPTSTATALEKSLVIGMYNFGKSFEAVFDSQN